jgi:O-antigen/teichoic acid export membrane protein
VKKAVSRASPISLSRGAFHKASVTVLDQSLVSFTNFFISLLLARYLVPDAYGVFVIFYAVFFLLAGLNNSLVMVPMATLGASLEQRETEVYFSSLTLLQILLLTIIGLVLTVIGLTIQTLTEVTTFSRILFAMTIAILPHLLQDYFRKLLYTRIEIKSALKNDILSYGLKIIGVILLIGFDRLSCSHCFIVMGLGSLIGCLYGAFQNRMLLGFDRLSLRGTLKQNWSFGRWMLANVVTQQSSNQIYIYISAGFLPTSMIGALGAARNILGFTHILLLGMDNIANPISSRRYFNHGKKGLNQLLKEFTVIGGLALVGYCLLVSFFSDSILSILYRNQYSGYGILVVLFSIQYLFAFMSRMPSYGIRAMRQPRTLFLSNLVTAIVSLSLCIPLIKYMGLYGACFGMILSQVILFAMLYFNYSRASEERF